jgi:hypothetical protein
MASEDVVDDEQTDGVGRPGGGRDVGCHAQACGGRFADQRRCYTHNSGDESHTDVQLQVGPGGKLIKRIFLLITLPCTNGRVGSALLRWPPRAERPARLPIARDGSFSGTLTGRQELLNPFLASEEYWLSGRFTRRGKAARLVVRARHVGEGGTVCDTGDRRVTARRVDAIAVRAGAS